ncbi:MAG: hypothetical protein Q4B12_06560 [Bowdeniella nasicola]|nr:hypothetical protein [Bowdeniella nasicola]
MTVLGFVPNYGTIALSEGADWVCSLETDSVWPEGTSVWVDFPVLGIRWDAVVDAGRGVAAFRVEEPETVVEKVPQGARFRLMMSMPGESESTEYVWFTGEVQRHD